MLVYDGDCVFCCRCARWVAKRSDIDLLADGEADLEALGLTVADTKRFVWWVDGDVKLSGHLAIGKVLRSLGGGWISRLRFEWKNKLCGDRNGLPESKIGILRPKIRRSVCASIYTVFEPKF